MLVIGYGNPGRMDDGLGPAFAARIAAAQLPGIEASQDYQLTVEHALALAGTDVVVFADAAIGASAPFEFGPLQPAEDGDLSSHSLSPAGLLSLCRTVFGVVPDAHVMAISGVAFGDVAEGLSPQAAQNLDRAVAFFTRWVAGCRVRATVEG